MPLPPYAPELNPVEQLWLNIKQRYAKVLTQCLIGASNVVIASLAACAFLLAIGSTKKQQIVLKLQVEFASV
jgi:hypothetical protein